VSKSPFVAAAAGILFAAISSASAFAQAAPAGDSAAGQKLFDMKCKICHTVTPDGKNGLGPGLYGVFGKKGAASPTFAYSPAFKAANVTWNTAKLDTWLQGPTKMIPGTKMILAPVTDAKQRADIIAYVATVGPPKAMPKKK
jgi:cytochrome c